MFFKEYAKTCFCAKQALQWKWGNGVNPWTPMRTYNESGEFAQNHEGMFDMNKKKMYVQKGRKVIIV